MKPSEIVYGFYDYLDTPLLMWFALIKGFEWIKNGGNDNGEYILTDMGADSDGEEIERLFERQGYCLLPIENGADGCSLEFEVRRLGAHSVDEELDPGTTEDIEVLDKIAKELGFVDNPEYKKWAQGEE
jgi:hypothetical protein